MNLTRREFKWLCSLTADARLELSTAIIKEGIAKGLCPADATDPVKAGFTSGIDRAIFIRYASAFNPYSLDSVAALRYGQAAEAGYSHASSFIARRYRDSLKLSKAHDYSL